MTALRTIKRVLQKRVSWFSGQVQGAAGLIISSKGREMYNTKSDGFFV